MRVVRWAATRGVAITPRGAGTSLEGNSIPVRGGLVLDLSRMTRVIEVNSEEAWVRVEPGIVYANLNHHLRDTGLFFPPSPGGSSDSATIGGMVNTNASGIYSVRYGATRDSVRGLVLVDGLGRVHRLGRSAPKSSSGLDLARLVVGSEGTLGVVAEVTLALTPRPEASRKVAFRFGEDREAAHAILALKQAVPELAAVEFLDRASIEAVNRFRKYDVPPAPSLFIELQGPADSLARAGEAAARLCTGAGGLPIDLGNVDPWEYRHHVTRAIRAGCGGVFIMRNDVGIPVSRLPELLALCRRLEEEIRCPLFAFGHAGLGVLHVLIPAAGREALRKARRANDRIIEYALTLGGTVSAEHGVGLGNRRFILREHGSSLALMRRIKRVFDPKGILNPGKGYAA